MEMYQVLCPRCFKIQNNQTLWHLQRAFVEKAEELELKRYDQRMKFESYLFKSKIIRII